MTSLLTAAERGITDVDSWQEALVAVAFLALVGFIVWCVTRD